MYKKNVLKLKRAILSFKKELNTDPYHFAYMGDKYECPVCNTKLAYFTPIGNDFFEAFDKFEYNYPLAHSETFNFLHYHCPKCYSGDRERMYALYFKKKFSNIDKSKKLDFVDFAPSSGLEKYYLRKLDFLNYRTADLFMEGVDDKIDLTDMKEYKDNMFDIFLCSHVLEHVSDDRKAMKELYRILKPGGWGIAMVPINYVMEEVFEDPNITTPADRWKYFGQDDHVRFYSKKGFIKRLQEAGFKVNQYGIDYFGADVFEKCGIHKRSVLYIVEKL